MKGTLVFNTNGPISVGMGLIGQGIIDYPGGFVADRSMSDSMSEIVALVESVKYGKISMFMQLLATDGFRLFRDGLGEYGGQVTFMLRMNIAQIKAIPEAVKDRVLDWACELERRGVHGDNQTFDAREKELAHAVTFNISNCRIEQLNNMGDNHKG